MRLVLFISLTMNAGSEKFFGQKNSAAVVVRDCIPTHLPAVSRRTAVCCPRTGAPGNTPKVTPVAPVSVVRVYRCVGMKPSDDA